MRGMESRGVGVGAAAAGAIAALPPPRRFRFFNFNVSSGLRNNKKLIIPNHHHHPKSSLSSSSANNNNNKYWKWNTTTTGTGSSGGGGGGGQRYGRIIISKAMPMENQNQSPTVYQGVYGPWTIHPSDIREVILYRSGLVMAAASFVVAASTAFLPPDSALSDALNRNLDLFYLIGAAGLGLSLCLIHIYVAEIKRTLQALWALGLLGSLATYTTLARPAGQGLVQYVLHNPTAVWFVGPLFAALTGLVFKEGLCYGKLEAGILTFVIPTILLGHLTDVMDDGLKSNLLGLWMALFIIFAGRKFTQPIKDDIGDKSVFMFNALPEEEKRALLEKQLERQE